MWGHHFLLLVSVPLPKSSEKLSFEDIYNVFIKPVEQNTSQWRVIHSLPSQCFQENSDFNRGCKRFRMLDWSDKENEKVMDLDGEKQSGLTVFVR